MYLFFKQKKEEKRKTGVEFWLSESSDVGMKFRRVRGAACGIGVCVCLFVCSERNSQTFSYPLFLIRNGTSLQLVLCHLV